VTNEPNWDEIFQNGARPASGAGATGPDDPPLTRREARERERAAEAAAAAQASPSALPPAGEDAPRPAPAIDDAPQLVVPVDDVARPVVPVEDVARPASPVEEMRRPTTSVFAEVTGGEEPPPRRKRRRLGWLWALLIVLVLGAAAATFVWVRFEDQVREVLGWQLPNDYEGAGNGTPVEIVIAEGDLGSDVANTLEKAGVTMTYDATYDLLASQAAPPALQPGTYRLQEEMSAASAIAALENPENRIVSTVLIQEGRTLPQVLEGLAEQTGVPLEDFQAVAEDYTSLGIPKEAPSAEGFLFPATYEFEPGSDARGMMQAMADRMTQSLDAAEVAPGDRLEVLTLASIIQKEGGSGEDFPKVSRVFTNRIEQGMLLQSDATVSYGAGSSSIFTTDEERADDSNPYNTYLHEGLPAGPISAPGDAAIDAALHPADGDWLFFVLVNGETGETKFSTTDAEHEAGVAQWQQWLSENPDWNTGG
jgi:UPF0755 protein